MYLKSIEIQGFKSFANKMKFEFHNGITGIVGPNGSGKSNVADAVRWVLGEQKIKQLRGAKMEDVIFAGTESRRPLGFAYVAITLDNADKVLPIDFDEVTISRRLFRSGESEYMINGSACRLKDINEMFYDTGIGKEGYSIIGQGQIDKILSGKPEERRELFDEAAGIVKFKRRKKEALKKLEDENQNLVRVEDILSELEKQVGPLAEQAETAKEYLRLRDELKINDVNMFLLQMEYLKKQLMDIDDKISIASNDLEDANQKFADTKREYEKLDQLIEELNLSIDNKKNELNDTSLHKEKLEGQIKVLFEQINSAKTNDEFLNARINSISDSINDHITEKEQLISNKEELEKQLTSEISMQSDLDSELANTNTLTAELTEQVALYKSEIIGLLNEKVDIQTKIQRYDTMLEQIGKRKDELSKKLAEFNTDKDAQEIIINELTENLDKINQMIISHKEEENTLANKIIERKQLNSKINAELEQSQILFHKEQSRLESLKNITERYEGYGNSIKKIMEQKDSKKGIVGVVADIIKVDKKYEVAIETALGGSIQNIVTDTETTAKELINFLKLNKFGRATFLPLSSMSNKTGFSNERVLSERGVIGLACDLVRMKGEYAGVAKYLLGRIVVADHIDNAISLARKYNYTLRIVTLEGEQLHAGGSMSGGAFKSSSNLLGRRREIDDIQKALAEIKEKRDTLSRQIIENKKELSELADQLDSVKLALQEQYLIQNTIKMNLHQAGGKKVELENSFDDFTKETDEIAVQMNNISQYNEALNSELKHNGERNTELENLVNGLLESIEQTKETEKEHIKASEELRMNIANLKNQHDFASQNIKRLQGEIEVLKEERSSILDNSKDSEKTVEARTEAIENIKRELTLTEEKIMTLKSQIDVFTNHKENQIKEHKDFFHKRESISAKITQLDREIYRLNAKKEKLDDLKENQINYMWDEYELTYSVALGLKNETAHSLSELKKIVVDLKGQIKSLGDVNVNAIEDYKNVGERYEFLGNQYDDLMTAKESLLKIIDELDAGMRKQFSEKLRDIQSEFDTVFKELFGGGKGEIELEDDGDLLETGIRIISQPPGKKLQNMMQMSGGEKALTAISLLFAFQNLKPSPFCLLDEIEAALDGSNVVRFAEYLHKLTENTQFIVITHRRGTMNCADRLYGITMQEKGISALVSVNLLEAELDK